MGAEIAAAKQRGRQFKPGESGNPAGKPKGTRNRFTIAAEMLLDGEAQTLTRKAIELALAGDPTALRLCMERLLPPRKERPTPLALPNVQNHHDIPKVLGVILSSIADGSLTINEAQGVVDLIESCRRLADPPAPSTATAPVIQVHFVSSTNEQTVS